MKSRFIIIKITLSCILITSCSQHVDDKQSSHENTQIAAANSGNIDSNKTEKEMANYQIELSEMQKINACKDTLAFMFGKSRRPLMKASVTSEGYIRIIYNRADDGTLWKNECKFEGDKIIWRGVDVAGFPKGPRRWRVDPLDDKITWKQVGDKIIVTAVASDGSVY